MITWLTLVLYLSLRWKEVQSAPRGSNGRNAYDALGVGRTVPQEDIRRKYKDLCLKYHPDKNVNRSDKEREQCEDNFKRVQEAYSDIGNAESRQKYDDSQRVTSYLSSSSNGANRGYGRNQGYDSRFSESLFRSYYEQQQRSQSYQSQRRTPFYVNGIDIANLFPPSDKVRSVYVTTVPIPLRYLYSGTTDYTFTIRRSLFHRYRAAFRGGAAMQIGLQTLLTSLAVLLKSGWITSLLFFGIYVHIQIPNLRKTHYSTPLQSGWKGGTRLKFQNVEPGIDVIFVLKEETDARYERCGNDLLTELRIGRKELNRRKRRKGGGSCRLHLPLLGESDGKIELPLTSEKVKELEKNHHILIVMKGRGWPIKGGQSHGDLKVKVRLVKDKKKLWGSRAQPERIPDRKSVV